MHIEITYEGTREERDEAAIRDLADYLDAPHRFELIVNTIRQSKAPEHLKALFVACRVLLGVSGLPLHALARRENLPLYRAWMAQEPDPRLTDPEGFPVDAPNSEVRQ